MMPHSELLQSVVYNLFQKAISRWTKRSACYRRYGGRNRLGGHSSGLLLQNMAMLFLEVINSTCRDVLLQDSDLDLPAPLSRLSKDRLTMKSVS